MTVKTNPKTKCTVSADGNHIEPCQGLHEQTEYGHPQRKKRGIFAWALTDMKTGKPSRTFFGVVSTASPSGWVFNFCPFCGTQIDAPCTQSEAE
jgi:hypothetical protein